jgi:hypothetical protein
VQQDKVILHLEAGGQSQTVEARRSSWQPAAINTEGSGFKEASVQLTDRGG